MRLRIALAGAWLVGAPLAGEDAGLPLLEGLGTHHRDVGTRVERAQQQFDQGLVLAWAFNHGAAERAFREAARLDPECAMCHWGTALVLGPHINASMDASAAAPAWEASQRALALAERARPVERALIEAVSARYAAAPPADRAPLDEAYAEAMREVARRFPDDADVATLLAEALMDLHPWDLWTKQGAPKPWTPEIVTTIERALELAPRHPGANHLYIHAVEASRDAGRATAAAELLHDLVPGAGHLVHMPAHVYIRTGRYWDAIEANRRAIAADRASLAHAGGHGATPGLYELTYVPHNPHFLWAAAALAGAGELAIATAREVAAAVDPRAMLEPGFGALQNYRATPYFALARFGRWHELLATAEPEDDPPYPRAIWRWAHGLAALRTGASAAAAADLAALDGLLGDPGFDGVNFWEINDALAVAGVAREHLAGELAFARGEREEAFARLRAAIAAEDALNYDEPPPWALPMRPFLGAMLLEAGRAAEAERLFREDLEIFPENGWALFGLAQALTAQGAERAAAEAEARFRRAFARADVALAAARL